LEELASRAAVESIWLHEEFNEPEIEIDLRQVGATRYLAKVEIKGSFRGRTVEEHCEIPVRIKLVACDRCSRMAGKYFQSTVQVRGNRTRSLTSHEIEQCKSIARSMADAGYRNGDQLSLYRR
jgi:nonsense-mediated mRNA decay protein 3